MRRLFLCAFALTSLLAVSANAQDQQEQSLGDVARQSREAKEERDKSATPSTKVFTENMPSGAAGKADLSRLDSPAAPPAERLASARRLIARSEQFLDSLAPMGSPA